MNSTFRSRLVLAILVVFVLGGCNQTAAPTADPRPVLETMVAATMQSVQTSTAAAEMVPTQAPAATATHPPVDPEAFKTELQYVLASRNFSALQPMLADPFTIAQWKSAGSESSPAEAVKQFHNHLLGSRETITFSNDIPADLQGIQMTDQKVTGLLLSKGWGPDGLGEALLTIAEQPDGRVLLDAVLFAPSGFLPPTPTAIQATVTVVAANLRSGPSPMHTLLGSYPNGSKLTVRFAAPGYDWGQVQGPDGKEGWVLLRLLKLDVEPETLPVYTELPPDSIHIFGWVEGGSGQPIDKAYVAVWQQEADPNRPQGVTEKNGMFHLYLPASSTGNWTAGIISVDCASSVMDAECQKQKEFVQLTQTITVPPPRPVVFVYNNILSATPAPVAEGCPNAETGKIPLGNSQDGYCLLYPEGFAIRQPATNVLEISGPPLDETTEPLTARLNIQRKELPAGSTLETVAAALWSGAQPGFTQNSITIGGQPGLYADHLLIGEANWKVRQVIVIRQSSYYILTFTPFDEAEAFAKALPDQQKLWNMVTSSLRFVP